MSRMPSDDPREMVVIVMVFLLVLAFWVWCFSSIGKALGW